MSDPTPEQCATADQLATDVFGLPEGAPHIARALAEEAAEDLERLNHVVVTLNALVVDIEEQAKNSYGPVDFEQQWQRIDASGYVVWRSAKNVVEQFQQGNMEPR